jgi:hypothetical protein
MLKKLILSGLLTLAASTIAAPVYLTFEGTISDSYSNAELIGPATGTATLVLLADFEASGYYTQNGVVYDLAGYSGYGYSYFLSDYVSGPAFEGGLGNPYDQTLHYGVDLTQYYGYGGYEFVVSTYSQANAYNQIVLYDFYNSLTSVEVGQNYLGSGYAYDGTNSAYWNGSFVLTNISDVGPASVPEPGTMALLGLGLLGIVGAARKSKSLKA